MIMNHVLTEARRAEILQQFPGIIEATSKGVSLLDVVIDKEIYISEILEDRTLYWFLFDNLNRQDAQLLWVWDFNYRKTGVTPFSK